MQLGTCLQSAAALGPSLTYCTAFVKLHLDPVALENGFEVGVQHQAADNDLVENVVNLSMAYKQVLIELAISELTFHIFNSL